MSSPASDCWEDPPIDPHSAAQELAGIRRPRLRPDRPVLWRDQTTIQIGEDVIIAGVTRAHVAWLASLDGLATSQQVVESLTIAETDAARLLRAARAAGALDDAARIPAPHRWLAADQRDRALAVMGVEADVHRSIDRVHEILDARDRTRVGVLGSGPVADAVCAALEFACISVSDETPGLVVLADAPHPDVPMLMEHLGLGTPHLHIGVLGRRAVAGPLVVPGRTSCLRCAQLHRRDADRAWPVLAVQWAHAVAAMRPAPMDPLLIQLAAGHAVALVRRWIDDCENTEAWADVAVEISLPTADVRRVPRPPHPLCGCLWSDF
jgi:bacteriocin biosynthesis cyclodehydratase domain-containing protein